MRASVAVFEPQTQGLAALTRRVKESFDPNGVLGPGRMCRGRVACKPPSPSRSSPIRTSRKPTRSCAPACIAASARRPARPTCCSATSSISPRGRIYLIKDMLENDRPATGDVVKHIDRCLSCLACMTTCPSGVHYMHLVDHARAHIEDTYRRPWPDRLVRTVLAAVLPYPGRFRAALASAGSAAGCSRSPHGRRGAGGFRSPRRARSCRPRRAGSASRRARSRCCA